jgi:Fe-S-cluster containining protein
MILNEILFQYQNLIFKVDSVCHELEKLYREHLVCKPGCSQCCEVERTVCSVEAYIAEQQLLTLSSQKIRRLKKLHRHDDETCPMLLRNRCVIYPARPIICRTHGLPILYREAERAFVDYCRLNFTQLEQDHEFEEKAILDMNPFNVELVQIDKKFSEYVLGETWRPDNRRSLKKILFNPNLKHK